MRVLTFILSIAILLSACQRDEEVYVLNKAPFLNEDTRAVDSLLQLASLEEKLGQMILLGIDHPSEAQDSSLLDWRLGHQWGSLWLEQTSTQRFLQLQDTLQTLNTLPHLTFTQQQILLNNQFSDAQPLPTHATFTGLPGDSLRQTLLPLYFQQAQALGINAAFFDIQQMEDTREKPYLLARLRESNTARVFQVARALPASAIEVVKDSAYLRSPYRENLNELLDYGLSGIVLEASLLEDQRLSPRLLKMIFRGQLKFGGLLIGAVQQPAQIGKALAADADMILVADDPQVAYQGLQRALRAEQLSTIELELKVQKIAMAATWASPTAVPAAEDVLEQPIVSTTVKASILPDLQETFGKADTIQNEPLAIGPFMKSNYWSHFSKQVYEQATTVIRPDLAGIPYENLRGHNFQLINLGESRFKVFEKHFGKYANFRVAKLTADKNGAWPQVKVGKGRTAYVFLLHAGAVKAQRDSLFLQSLARLALERSVVLVHFGASERLAPFTSDFTIVQVPEHAAVAEEYGAQLLLGGAAARGRLDIDANHRLRAGTGADLDPIRLSYDLPQTVGIAPEKLVGIDAIAKTAIQEGAMPGCQVAVAKGGKIIYSKAFGYHDYRKKQRVQNSDLYDVASLTKVAATTLAAMQLYEKQQFKLNDKLKDHLSMPKNSSLRNIYLKSLFTHESGLQPSMPVVPFLLYRDQPNAGCDSFFCATYSEEFPIEIAKGFYFNQGYLDTLWQQVHQMPVSRSKRYRYSDANFVLIQKMLEEKSGQSIDEYVTQNFYHPLGLRNTDYRPLRRHQPNTIVPTQNDNRWRHQMLRGYVHDETAALLGGVAGHAGLFSNAEEMAVIFQMLLNGGTYGGQRFLQPETIQLFTSNRFSRRRGLGFDRPHPDSRSAYSRSASQSTFGHTGFTGTCVWTDPAHDLVFVFLSNRLHPNVKNRKLFRDKVRERIHQVVYDALGSYKPEMPELKVTP